VRLKPLPVSRLPATKRTPFHSNIAGDSIGAPGRLQQDQLSAEAGALQKVCFARLKPTLRSGTASQRSPVARTISSPSRAPSPTGAAAAEANATPSAVESSEKAVGTEDGNSSSAPQIEKYTWFPNSRGRQAALPAPPGSGVKGVQVKPSSVEATRTAVWCAVGSPVSQNVTITHSFPPKRKSLGCRGSRLATPSVAACAQVLPLSPERIT
jgi:hypothetical protein